MSVSNNRKFKISLNPESVKGQPDGHGGRTQGLRTGDIVRRQYFDGANIIYTLMCVTDYGVEEVEVEDVIADTDTDTSESLEPQTRTVLKQQPWFIGVLLDGDAPKVGEILDFVRVTNLFDQSRSGALYLTATDDESPFMDIIDGIGKNCSLSWPEGLGNANSQDPQNQYIVSCQNCKVEYIESELDRNRICHIQKGVGGNAIIKQSFTQYIHNPNQVLVSFWAKSSSACNVNLSLAYDDEARVDGVVEVKVNEDWAYHLYKITVDYSGRHKRAVSFNLDGLPDGESLYIADFNTILLSSLSNFDEASQIRIGKLTGISDTVFGKLDSYGGYFQKIFATGSAHISGTLTAGDENGFASTFYAGKIHKNTFINSISPIADVNSISDAELLTRYKLQNPTGMGAVFEITDSISMTAQTADWLHLNNGERIGKAYTFSFWVYSYCACQLSINQNGKQVGIIQVSDSEILKWQRLKITFNLLDTTDKSVILSISSSFQPTADDDNSGQNILLLSAPQLESGKSVSQYQPTDEVVNHLCEDYGAWFNKGGVGGTIQNPLLRFNESGEGEIASRGDTFRVNSDGSGHIGKGNVKWDRNGNTTFSENVKLSWQNLSSETQKQLSYKGIKIIGADTFTIMQDDVADDCIYSPENITLSLNLVNLISFDTCKWYCLSSLGNYIEINDSDSMVVDPNASYWAVDGSPLTIKCVLSSNGVVYEDTISIKKQYTGGFSVEVTSNQGSTFKNGECTTTLKARVYFQGRLVSSEYINKNFLMTWKKYYLPDLLHADQDWFREIKDENGVIVQPAIDINADTIEINGVLDGSVLYVCELSTKEGFVYNWPIEFS